MKKTILNIGIAIVEACFVFALVFSINLKVLSTSKQVIFVNGVEPMYQEAFTPADRDKINELDEQFRTNYDFYRGYSYSGMTTTFSDSAKNQHYLYMASKSVDMKLFFPNIKEGKMFEYAENYDKLPIVVGGKFYEKSKIDDEIEMSISAEKKDAPDKIVKAVIVGKIDCDKYYRYPERISNDIAINMAMDGFVVSPDAYVNEIFDLSGKQIYFNINNLSKGYSQEKRNELRAISAEYVSFPVIPDAYGSTMFEYLFNLKIVYSLGALLALVILFIKVLQIIKTKRKKDYLPFLISQIIGITIVTILLAIYNSLGGVLSIFNISYLAILFVALFYIVGAATVSLFIVKGKKEKIIVEEGQKHEKI